MTRQPGALFQVAYWIQGTARCPSRNRCVTSAGRTRGSPSPARPDRDPRWPVPAVRAGAGDRHGRWLVDPWHGQAVLVSPVLGALAVLTLGGLAGRLACARGRRPRPWPWPSLPADTRAGRRSPSPWRSCCCSAGCPWWPTRSRSVPAGPGPARPGVAELAVLAVAGHGRGALGGLALGLPALAAPNVLPDLIPVIPFVGLLAAARRPQALR